MKKCPDRKGVFRHITKKEAAAQPPVERFKCDRCGGPIALERGWSRVEGRFRRSPDKIRRCPKCGNRWLHQSLSYDVVNGSYRRSHRASCQCGWESDELDGRPAMGSAVEEQIADAYRVMAKLKYRPSAPGDGLGNVTVAEHELDLEDEIECYTRSWEGQERQCTFRIGCPDFHHRRAMVFAIEAARQMCTGVDGREWAIMLLEHALEALHHTEA